jgi:hypothetical protein
MKRVAAARTTGHYRNPYQAPPTKHTGGSCSPTHTSTGANGGSHWRFDRARGEEKAGATGFVYNNLVYNNLVMVRCARVMTRSGIPLLVVPWTRAFEWRCATTDDPQTGADHTASAAERQRSGSGAAAGLQQIALHQTDCRFRSLQGHESEVIHDPRADTWRCSRLGVQSRKHG